MSLVVFPFKAEDLSVLATNLSVAANHERVSEVWAVTSVGDRQAEAVAGMAGAIGTAASVPIRVFPQERIGRYRPGKGDAMNTAIRRAAERGFARAHFYDADITNFDASWIDGAEHGADLGFGVVRHRFPRAATDAMVTWMVTRPALAKLFPGTVLPRLGQPLGGEVLLTGGALTALAEDRLVGDRSDWGIDTVITYATTLLGLGVYEHNATEGKRHALYGSLLEIRDMVVECLDAVASLDGRSPPSGDVTFQGEPDVEVPEDLKRTVAYDLEATLAAVSEPPGEDEEMILERLGVAGADVASLGRDRWGEILDLALAEFELGDKAWESAFFRLWVHRVVHYTRQHAALGYDHALDYLGRTVAHYERSASRGRWPSRRRR